MQNSPINPIQNNPKSIKDVSIAIIRKVACSKSAVITTSKEKAAEIVPSC